MPLFAQSLKFTTIIESAEEGGYVIKCIELPVTTEGETKKEALANLKEAVEGYMEVRTELSGKSRFYNSSNDKRLNISVQHRYPIS